MGDYFSKRGAGGTPGGVGTFLIGLIMALIGGYLLTNLIEVSTGFWGIRYRMFGGFSVSAFSITLVIFLIGVGLVFADYRSKIGLALTGISLLWMIVGVIANLDVYFRRTSLFVTLAVFVLLVGGVGLMARSLRAVE